MDVWYNFVETKTKYRKQNNLQIRNCLNRMKMRNFALQFVVFPVAFAICSFKSAIPTYQTRLTMGFSEKI